MRNSRACHYPPPLFDDQLQLTHKRARAFLQKSSDAERIIRTARFIKIPLDEVIYGSEYGAAYNCPHTPHVFSPFRGFSASISAPWEDSDYRYGAYIRKGKTGARREIASLLALFTGNRSFREAREREVIMPGLFVTPCTDLARPCGCVFPFACAASQF